MKKTITFAALAFIVTIICLSCKKETTTVTVTTIDTVTVSDTSIMGLLTGKQWKLDTAYSGYTTPGSGTLIYARGGSSNSINLDDLREIFWRDGQYDVFDNAGNYISSTWSFTGIDSSLIQTIGSYTDYARVLKLDATHLNLYDSTNSTLDIATLKP
jgi:hypothetical protein